MLTLAFSPLPRAKTRKVELERQNAALMFHRVIASVQSKMSSSRALATSFEDRMTTRVKQATSEKITNRYADRERGDLSEYANSLHGLSTATSGRDLEVLRAWDRGDFNAVIDVCDDIIEADSWEFERKAKSGELYNDKTSRHHADTQNAENTRSEMYLFHRNIKASALNRLGKFTDALKVADETIKLTNRKDRDSLCLKATALNFLGSVEKNSARDEEALRLFTEALNLIPAGGHDLESSLNQATLYLKLGRHNEALSCAQNALEYVTVSPDASVEDDPFAERPSPLDDLKLASSSSQSDLDAPLDAADGTQAGPPKKSFHSQFNPETDSPDPMAYRQAGLDREHVKYDADFRLLLATIHLGFQRFEDTITQAKLGIKAIKRKGALGSPVLMRLLEVQLGAFMTLQRFAEAELICKMLIKMYPDDITRLDHYAQIAMALKRSYEDVIDTAKGYISRLSSDPTEYPRLLKVLLAIYHYYEKVDEALKVCDELIKLNRETEVAFPMKAMLLLRKKRESEAVDVCILAEENGLLGPDLLVTKALSYEGLEDHDLARFEYERVITKFPQYAPAHFRYASSLARLGRNDEALRGFDRAIECAKQNGQTYAQVLFAKANLLRDTGKLKESMQVYAELSQLDPEMAKQMNSVSRQFQAGNPAAFASEEAKMRQQRAKDLIGTAGLGAAEARVGIHNKSGGSL